ncbi:MAG: hypothetical protein C4K58_06995 [Flavobacteriaceae bacterium]|nr:MAG: hypothetical protein C4K58_06995 [Flavobacteriaceae bacterium]
MILFCSSFAAAQEISVDRKDLENCIKCFDVVKLKDSIILDQEALIKDMSKSYLKSKEEIKQRELKIAELNSTLEKRKGNFLKGLGLGGVLGLLAIINL